MISRKRNENKAVVGNQDTQSKGNARAGKHSSGPGTLFSAVVFFCAMAVTLFVNTLFLVPVLTKRGSVDKALPNHPFFRDQARFHKSQNETSYQNLFKLRASNRKEERQDALPRSDDADVKKMTGHAPILEVFREAGLPPMNESMIALLPTWEDVVAIVGEHPIIGGLDTCEPYREKVPAVERMLGSAGMFNSGTNLVTHLLKNNCKIPERVEKYGPDASREAHGMRWQVPWGKHSPATFKTEHSTEKAKAINKEWIMPVVTIRSPYSWMHSMCRNSYTARWPHHRKCPNLKVDRGHWNEVTTKFADQRTFMADSLVHLWNKWYRLYERDADFPRLIVRMEDLVFHAKETITTVCECVGGKIRTDRNFTYIVDSAKADSPGHDKTTGLMQAWIKYSKPTPKAGGFEMDDYVAAKEGLDEDLMHEFGYSHPPPL